MKPLTPIGSPSPLRLLNKGPDYLRWQMDTGNRGRSVSAVERLEADKAKYVKSQQVINTKQEPALVPCATPPPPPRRPLAVSACSTPRLPHRWHQNGFHPATSTPLSPRDDSEDDSRKENRHGDDDDDDDDDDDVGASVRKSVEERNRNNAKRVLMPSPRMPVASVPLVAPHSAPVLRRSTGKRMLRPDSLVIYRQKKECKSPTVTVAGGNGATETKGYSFVRRLFQGSMREKSGGGGGDKMTISEEKAPSRDGDSRMSWSNDKNSVDGGTGGGGNETRRSSRSDRARSVESDNLNVCLAERPAKKANGALNGTTSDHSNNNTAVAFATATTAAVADDDMDPWKPVVPLVALRTGLRRSKSELRLRSSSLALSEQERFFDFCGLDLDMVEWLGAENFLSGASSIDTLSLILRSVAGGSEPSEFSRHSGEGLFQEELAEQLPTGVSIIERNARVIKWLYGCKNAQKEGPKESTV